MNSNITPEKLREIKEIFYFFDKNKSGSIALEEIGNMYRALGMNPTNTELNNMLANLDADSSGTIEFDEFLSLFKNFKFKPITEDQLKQAFKLFDKDQSGLIETDELVNIMELAGEKLSLEEAEEIINEFDLDKNGSINYTEFARMILHDD